MSGSLILSKPLGAGDAIVMTGSDSCRPLVLLTSTTFALTMRLQYVAETTRFSNSTNLMIAGIPNGTCPAEMRQLQIVTVAFINFLSGARRLAFAGHRVFSCPVHQ